MTSFIELQEQIAALTAQAEQLREQETAEVIGIIRSYITTYNLAPGDIFPKKPARGPSKGFRVVPKYRHPSTGEVWTGRGRAPQWFVAAQAAGYTEAQLLIPPAV